jgi:hypothetical protein
MWIESSGKNSNAHFLLSCSSVYINADNNTLYSSIIIHNLANIHFHRCVAIGHYFSALYHHHIYSFNIKAEVSQNTRSEVLIAMSLEIQAFSDVPFVLLGA